MEKLERRQASVRAVEARKFNWGRFLRLSLRVMVFAVGATILWRVLVGLGLTFLDSPLGQVVLFFGLYALMFRWINREMLFGPPGRR